MGAQSRLREKTIPFEVKIKRLITSMHLNCIGTVADVSADGSRIDAVLPYLDCNSKPITIKGIEVLRIGTHKVKVKVKPEVGDVVLLFAQQDYWPEVTFAHVPTPKKVSSDAYNDVTIKALLVQTNEDNPNATIVDIKSDAVSITAPLRLDITCDSAVNITNKGDATITNKGSTNVTCEGNATITDKGATTITCEGNATITNKGSTTITNKGSTSITCEGDASVDASGHNVNVTASSVKINNHFEVT